MQLSATVCHSGAVTGMISREGHLFATTSFFKVMTMCSFFFADLLVASCYYYSSIAMASNLVAMASNLIASCY